MFSTLGEADVNIVNTSEANTVSHPTEVVALKAQIRHLNKTINNNVIYTNLTNHNTTVVCGSDDWRNRTVEASVEQQYESTPGMFTG